MIYINRQLITPHIAARITIGSHANTSQSLTPLPPFLPLSLSLTFFLSLSCLRLSAPFLSLPHSLSTSCHSSVMALWRLIALCLSGSNSRTSSSEWSCFLTATVNTSAVIEASLYGHPSHITWIPISWVMKIYAFKENSVVRIRINSFGRRKRYET